jgi:UDP-N-acetylmuramyl pentapeptide synthase
LPLKTLITYGLYSSAMFKAENIVEKEDSTEFDLRYLTNTYRVKLKLLGFFNVYNALAAIGTAFALKVPMEKILKSLEEFEPLK